MRRAWSRVAVIVAVLGSAAGGAGTEAKGQYPRRTPVVEAVQKTRASVVSVKVEKSGGWGRKEIGGSGVVVDERGYVVTNHHVVASASRVSVYLADGTELAAELFADDARHDLAVLRLGGTRKLQALRFAPSADLMVGETVIAIGNPYGYANTVSTGIVSALGREVTMPGGEVLRDLIQVTASINPGNSGGPLLNINGELIGINVALRDGAQGIAFALTADAVQKVLARHLSAARIAGVSHGLGCTETTLSEDGPDRQRVVIEAAAGPAASAGLKRGDGLLKVGGRAVGNRLDVERAFWHGRPGDKVAVTVLRSGKEVSLTLTLGPASELERAVARTTELARPSGGPARPLRVEAPGRLEAPPQKTRKP